MIVAHYRDQIIANQSTKSIKISTIDSNVNKSEHTNQSQLISNIDSNYMKRYCF